MSEDISDDTRGGRGRRAGMLVTALAGVTLLAAACSGGPRPATAGRTEIYQKALAYAKCMRSHGEPSWPDPTSNGTFETGIDLNTPQARSAHGACMYLMPASGGHVSAAQLQEDERAALKQSACMRAHGITNFPDPVMRPNGGNTVHISTASGIDPHSPQFQAASRACE